ncbi:MAG TPA: hypothetical protein VK861_04310 [Bacteroidales bacterium]|nr:hypothetical protein [Bacteroidales bacterium]
MNEFAGSKDVLQLDVEKVLFSKNPTLRKKIPRFLISYLKRIVHQDELNDFLRTY